MGGSRGSKASSAAEQVTLRDGPLAALQARQFLRERLNDFGMAELTADAELVVSELVTNAVLHVGLPVQVRVHVDRGGVRIEVADRSSRAPVRGVALDDAMTGRGLGVVGALTRSWGVEPSPDGKVVWCELGFGPTRPTAVDPGIAVPPAPDRRLDLDDAEALLARWSDDLADDLADDDDEVTTLPVYHVDLGDVPTHLLLEAKAQVDNLVRELALASTGAVSGRTQALPEHLASLVDTVVTRFARPRQIIKRLATATLDRGEDHTRLVFDVTEQEVAAGHEYLAALDEVDGYARAVRLLTLEAPPQHKVFRRWYVQSLTTQVARAAAGRPPARLPTFEECLLEELAEVAVAQRWSDRAARLHSVTAILAGATTEASVAQAVLDEAVPALGAVGGGLLLGPDRGRLQVPVTVGYDQALVERLRREDPAAELPAAVTVRSGAPVWVESRDERDARFPQMRELEPDTVAACAAPLVVGAHVIGALRFSFDRPHPFDSDERQFVLALAAATAQALDRARLLRAQEASNDRLTIERARAEGAAASVLRLQRLTAALVAATTIEDVVTTVADVGVAALGAVAGGVALSSADGTQLEISAATGYDEAVLAAYAQVPLDSAVPMAVAARTGRPVLLPDSHAIESAYPGAVHARSYQARAFLPLGPDHAPFGVLLAAFAEPRDFDSSERELLVTVARQCGQALERARAFAAEQDARARTSFLVGASDLLTSSLDPPATLRHLCDLIVPRLADWAAVFLRGESPGGSPDSVVAVAAAHRDPPVQVRLRQAVAAGPPTGWLADLAGTAQSQLLTDLPERDSGLRTEDGESIGARADSALAVPLIARGRMVGTIVLARGDDPAFGREDLALVQDLAARAAVAVDNAVQYAAQRDAALTLQRSLLPQRPPRLPGVEVAWRYLAGAAGAAVGGDWYDVLPLGDGRLALCIGDVMGRGLQAAAIMGQLRATARALATMHQRPAQVLAQLDAATARLEQEAITTCLYAVLDPASGQLTVASAGHLAPLVAVPGRPPYYLPVEPGLPLGTGPVTPGADALAEHPELVVTLPAGTTLVLFTDGLVEDRARPLDVGLHTLAQTAAESTRGPEEFCDRALAALGRDTRHADDTAMLVVTLGSPV